MGVKAANITWMRRGMEESEVVQYVREFFEKLSWKVKWISARKHHFERDIVADKEGSTYIIQVKGSRPRQESYQIQYVIGEVVAEMRESDPQIHYGIALPESVAKKLWKFGEEGIKALRFHLFIVTEYGDVYHLNPEKVVEYMANLRAWGEDQGLPTTLATPP